MLKRIVSRIFRKAKEKITSKISNQSLALLVDFVLLVGQDLILLLLDKDKENAKQITAYFKAKRVDLIKMVHSMIKRRVDTVDDPIIVSFLHNLNDTQMDVLLALTDENPDNKGQLKKIGKKSFFDMLAVLAENAEDLLESELAGEIMKDLVEDLKEEHYPKEIVVETN